MPCVKLPTCEWSGTVKVLQPSCRKWVLEKALGVLKSTNGSRRVLPCLKQPFPVSKGNSASLPDLVPFWTETDTWNGEIRSSAIDSMRNSGKLFEKELAYVSTKSYVPEAPQRITGKTRYV